MTLNATVAGVTQTLAQDAGPAGPLSGLSGIVDVCAVPGGSDLPGAVVGFASSASDGAASSMTYALPDMGVVGPVVGMETDPPAGSRVKPGDTIAVKAFAMLLATAHGIKSLRLQAGAATMAEVGNVSGSASPIACDFGRFSALLVTSYVVPPDPPPVVTLAATAIDFLGRQGEASTATAAFPTVDGEVWEGSLSGTLQTPGCSPVAASGAMLLIVDSDGNVTGNGRTTDATYFCGENVIPTASLEYTVAGKKTDDAFVLVFPDGVQLTSGPIRGGRATVTQDTGAGTVTIELACQNCGD
jgi:hypothetical protein